MKSDAFGFFLGRLLGGFNIVAIFCKIIVLWFLGFFMLSRFVTNVVFDFFPPWNNPPHTTDAVEPWNIIFLVLGVYFFLCLFRRIFWPRIEPESFRPTLKMNISDWTIVIPNPVLKPMEFLFVTSHPLYVFIDAACLFIAGIFLYIGSYDSPAVNPANNGVNYFCYTLFFALTLFMVLFRQFSWFVLGRKVKVEDRFNLITRPLITLYSILAAIGILTFIVSMLLG
ncbi:MAG: hypothetical protein MUD12_16520 [Spirochaetes bacterium]|jgi:hypothetical protein|nr:hypothetical protein [Spirochaetota bacterium]